MLTELYDEYSILNNMCSRGINKIQDIDNKEKI
jgi:hypothetical protein